MRVRVGKIIAFMMAILMILAVSAVALAVDVGIDITAPSDAETTLAKGRSFYVMGTFKDGAKLNDGDKVTVELKDASGKVVRSISTTIKANENMYINYPGLSYYGNDRSELITVGMPDLIWDGKQLSSFKNGDIKLYYNDTEFAAIIPGGEGLLSDGIGLVNSQGYAYEALEEGEYTLSVYIIDNTDVKNDATDATGSAEKKIKIGVTADKLLSRFSPQAHMNRVEAMAKENGWRIYNDLFPGYWYKNDIFCEITSQWRAADAIEYAQGKAHFVIYNVKTSSATYSVELAMLQRMAAIENPDKLQCYYYEYGEPTAINKVNGDILPFAPKDKLQIVRAELTPLSSKENVYQQDKLEALEYDLDLADGVNASVGENVSLYGVTAPIQINLADLRDNGNNSYYSDNRITDVRYNISGDGVKLELEKKVKLTRMKGGWDNLSELEFKHDIPITEDMAGKTLMVSLAGYDKYGRLVEGTSEQLQIIVGAQAAATGATPPQTADTATVIGFMMLAAVMLMLALKRREA